jgi:glycosyltransferase involved in cell wall biosynthesis
MNITVDICSGDSLDGVGGPLVWVQRLPLDLRELGFSVRVRFLNWHGSSQGGACKELRRNGFAVSATSYQDTETDIRSLLSQMHSPAPDVVVTNCIVPAYYAGKYLRACGIPTIGVQYSDDQFDAGLRDHFVFGRSDYRVSGVVCVSEFLRQRILERQPDAVEVRRIACGVPVPQASAKPPGEILRIAYLGRMVEEAKRVSDVARAFARATKEIKGVEAVMFGEGPARPQVERILAQEAASAVRIAGYLDSETLQRRLLACHVIVLLSDYEGLPMALTEAMACGCVPVCLRIRSGIPELVEDGITGLLVSDRGESFIHAICRLRSEPGLWERLSRAARCKVETGYSRPVCAAQWAELIQCLHQNSNKKQAITIPRRIKLPPTHPGFAHEDRRRPPPPPLVLRLYRRTRIAAGRVRRQLLGQPNP